MCPTPLKLLIIQRLQNRNQYYYSIQFSMQNKRVQIPYHQQLLDSPNNCQLDATADLIKMREMLYQNIEHYDTQIALNSPNLDLLILNKKRLRNNTPQSQCQNSDLNLAKLGFRQILKQQKVKIITRNFINKIKRNISLSKPIEFYPYIAGISEGILNKKGFEIPNWFDLSFAFVSIIQIFILIFVYTLSLVFVDNFIDQYLINTLQTFSMCFYTIQIIINFVSIKTIQGRKVHALKQIFLTYIKRKFVIDLICLIVLIIDINTRYSIINYLRLCVVLKIRQCLQKMQKIENVFVNNFYKQQYWSLVKVFLVNFGFAHVLAVLLLAMAKLNQESNWINKINLIESDQCWYELYSWAYYWGTTIMLTVGFGDLSASNYKEALCLTVIQTFSCILLAYNINCVGNLINNIRSQGLQKTKNYRIFRKLVENNEINEEIEEKVCNFIDQSDKMRKQFGFQDEKQFVSNLPPELKAEFLKQSNIKIFKNIKFFRLFTQKTLLNLAESIEVKIAHPEQIIFRSEDDPKYLILKEGKVGYCTKLSGSDYSGTLIDKIKINKKQNPMILYLGFLAENARNPKYKIKSLHYSMIYFISLGHLLEIMKNSATDFQNYCRIKDKSKHIIDEFQIVNCQHCPTKHTKMSCPKLHYVPIYQLIVYRHLEDIKVAKNERVKYERKRQNNFLSYQQPLRKLQNFQKISETIFKTSRRKTKKMKQDSMIKREQSLQNENKYKSSGLKGEGNPFIIKNIVKMINKQSVEDESEQFQWQVQSDVANNYKFYFPESNASILSGKVVFRKQINGYGRSCTSFRQLSKMLLEIQTMQ